MIKEKWDLEHAFILKEYIYEIQLYHAVFDIDFISEHEFGGDGPKERGVCVE